MMDDPVKGAMMEMPRQVEEIEKDLMFSGDAPAETLLDEYEQALRSGVRSLTDEERARYEALLEQPDAFMSGPWREFLERALECGVCEADHGRMDYVEAAWLAPMGL